MKTVYEGYSPVYTKHMPKLYTGRSYNPKIPPISMLLAHKHDKVNVPALSGCGRFWCVKTVLILETSNLDERTRTSAKESWNIRLNVSLRGIGSLL
jgi:hypothetical protein